MTIIDVRSLEEYKSGHVDGAKNIPLQELKNHVSEIKTFEQPLVICCASGYRSGQSTSYLQSVDIPCENGGSWIDLKNELNYK